MGSSSGDIIITLPTQEGNNIAIHKKAYDKWVECYPNISVMGELTSLKAWLISNPNKRKNCKDMPSYVLSWLSRHNSEAQCRPTETRESIFSGIDYKSMTAVQFDLMAFMTRSGLRKYITPEEVNRVLGPVISDKYFSGENV